MPWKYCVMLCRQFGFTAADITSHYEGYKKGIASNHSDPKHWFDKHGYSMDMFRREVDRKLKGEIEVMGKVVNADALIQWINSNAVETEEGSVEPAPRPRIRRYIPGIHQWQMVVGDHRLPTMRTPADMPGYWARLYPACTPGPAVG